MSLNDFIKVGSKIKNIRKSKGISQKYIAEEILKIPRSTYSNYENDNRVPDKETLEKIANALEVGINLLINTDQVERKKEGEQLYIEHFKEWLREQQIRTDSYNRTIETAELIIDSNRKQLDIHKQRTNAGIEDYNAWAKENGEKLIELL